MYRRSFLQSATLLALAQVATNTMTRAALAATAKEEGNPLLDPWIGPHGGFPRFDMVKVDAFKPAILEGMDLNRVEITTIAGNSAAPSFQNTFAALDDSGRPLKRATQIYQIYTSTMNDKRTQAVETHRIEPLEDVLVLAMLRGMSMLFVEPLDDSVGWLLRRADQMRRNALAPPFELPLVEEAKPG